MTRGSPWALGPNNVPAKSDGIILPLTFYGNQVRPWCGVSWEVPPRDTLIDTASVTGRFSDEDDEDRWGDFGADGDVETAIAIPEKPTVATLCARANYPRPI